MTIIAAIIFFGVLIFAHELGHFIAARLSGIVVKVFSIGFGPSLFEIKGKKTKYRIALVPLGGYVRLMGEVPEEEEMPGSFQSKHPVVKIIVALSGPVFNFLCAVIVFALLNLIGYYVYEPVVGKLIEGYPAEKAGLKPGDRIVRIEGDKISVWNDIPSAIRKYGDKELEIEVNRKGKILVFKITPVKEKVGEGKEERERFLIGISPDFNRKKIVRMGFWQGLYQGIIDTGDFTIHIFKALGSMIKEKKSLRDLRGPIFIFKEAGEAVKEGIRPYLFLLAVISINLAILNLIPIPILDGGLILIAFFELIVRRKAPEKVVIALKVMGILLIFALISLALYNDIVDLLLRR